MPSGLTYNEGVLSGTPTGEGFNNQTYTFWFSLYYQGWDVFTGAKIPSDNKQVMYGVNVGAPLREDTDRPVFDDEADTWFIGESDTGIGNSAADVYISFSGNWYIDGIDTGITPLSFFAADGKSSYDLAVENGFTGTVQQWLLSLVGPTGPTGPTGATGKGIASIMKTSTIGNLDTYTITYTDNATVTFTVTNGSNGVKGADGKGIVSIMKTKTDEKGDTYTVTYTDGEAFTFTVNNGLRGPDGPKGDPGPKGCGNSSASIIAMFSLLAMAFVVVIKKQF